MAVGSLSQEVAVPGAGREPGASLRESGLCGLLGPVGTEAAVNSIHGEAVFPGSVSSLCGCHWLEAGFGGPGDLGRGGASMRCRAGPWSHGLLAEVSAGEGQPRGEVYAWGLCPPLQGCTLKAVLQGTVWRG